jgi:hypothetical protein
MKKLIYLIAATGILFGCATIPKENFEYQKKVFSQLGISEKFLGYQNKLLRRQLIYDGGVLYELKDYDTNGDRKKDVRETYNLFGKHPSIPFSYMFDSNFDGEFSDDEIWMEDSEDGVTWNEDGLNGNEKRCDLEIVNANGEKI